MMYGHRRRAERGRKNPLAVIARPSDMITAVGNASVLGLAGVSAVLVILLVAGSCTRTRSRIVGHELPRITLRLSR